VGDQAGNFGGGLRYHKEKRAVDRSAEVTGVILEKGEMLPPNRVRRKRRTLERAKDAERRPGENKLDVVAFTKSVKSWKTQ